MVLITSYSQLSWMIHWWCTEMVVYFFWEKEKSAARLSFTSLSQNYCLSFLSTPCSLAVLSGYSSSLNTRNPDEHEHFSVNTWSLDFIMIITIMLHYLTFLCLLRQVDHTNKVSPFNRLFSPLVVLWSPRATCVRGSNEHFDSKCFSVVSISPCTPLFLYFHF
jgi:hypothetical protein